MSFLKKVIQKWGWKNVGALNHNDDNIGLMPGKPLSLILLNVRRNLLIFKEISLIFLNLLNFFYKEFLRRF